MGQLRVLTLLIRLDGGGAERSVARIVGPLASRSVLVDRYAIDPAWPGEDSQPDKTLTSKPVRGPLRLLVAARRLASTIRASRPDVVHLHCEAPEIVGLIARLLTIGQKFSIVVTDHSMKSWSGVRAPLGWLIRNALQGFGAVYVSCFNSAAKQERARVILNPSGKLGVLAASPDSGGRLVVIGRVIESKRIDEVLRAARLSSWNGEILIVGAGPNMESLQTLAEELDLKVSFLGHQRNPWSSVAPNDLYVSASSFEGEPLTLIEAMQYDLSVLVSDIPAHVKVLKGHPGIFASRAQLSEFLSLYLSEPAHGRFKVDPSLRKEILAARDPMRIAEEWESLYRAIT
ncbi:glycosyltransferase family 4 protein [Paenarthrobacter nitroguajacolicus]|uniref:glycosyltransferase family 4 protein n=1 Tax=Paenarthrobacter nitroguajacolicus TaxID=211146 RepID=UPI003AE50570